jgi:hypothetical protein
MGRVGGACHNAAAESFFSLLQKNLLDTQRWETGEEPATTPTGPRQAHSGRVDLLGTELAAAVRVRIVTAGLRSAMALRIADAASRLRQDHLVPVHLTHADMGI